MFARLAEGGFKTAFAPLVDPATRLLILGSLPGDASLAAAQYYAHPRNLFWRFAGELIGRSELPELPYAERLPLIAAGGIGLWDVLSGAERHGSLDAAIRAHRPAALAELVAVLPQLRAIAFNGRLAAAHGRKAIAGGAFALIDLPSTSPANAAIPLAEKRAQWLALKQFLI